MRSFGKEGSSSVIGEVEDIIDDIGSNGDLACRISKSEIVEEGTKERERERKEERAILIKTRLKCDSGSSSCTSSHSPSSESSDGDCEEDLSMKQLRSNDVNQFIEIESAYLMKEAATQEDQRTEIVLGANDSSPRNLREAFCNLDITMRVAIEFFVVVIRVMALASEHLAGRLRYAWATRKGRESGASALLEECERTVRIRGFCFWVQVHGKVLEWS